MGNPLRRQALVESLLLLLFLAICTPGLQAKEPEVARIERLLRVVAVSKVSFIIEGTVYGADEMAEHLRNKLERADKKNLTVEYFISRLANSSSQSGKPYKVALENGQTTYAGPWLRGLLRDIEKGLQTVQEPPPPVNQSLNPISPDTPQTVPVRRNPAPNARNLRIEQEVLRFANCFHHSVGFT